MGSKNSFRDYSFILGDHILRSVNLSSFDKPISIITSTSCLASKFISSLGAHVGNDSFGRVHGREYPSDGLDRVQDPQGVFGS